jgi:hypothetical protein
MAAIQMVDVHLPTNGCTVILSRHTEPEPDQAPASATQDLFARPTAAQNYLRQRSGITMTTQAVVPTL